MQTPACMRAAAALAFALLILAGCGGRSEAPVAEPPPEAPETPVQEDMPAGTPDGRMFVDAREYPWSAIGRLNTGGRGYCTATVIGERFVLASAQCLYDESEGRWWRAQDLHFITAYHQGKPLAGSPVEDFDVPDAFNPRSGASFENMTNNWALVTLSKPVGLFSGWLGLRWLDESRTSGRTIDGETVLRAGFRRDQPHGVAIHYGCADGVSDDIATPTCAPVAGEMVLPLYLLAAGDLYLLLNSYMAAPTQVRDLAQAVALSGVAFESSFDRGKGPHGESPVAPTPQRSIAKLLRQLDQPGDGSEDDSIVRMQQLIDEARSLSGGS